MLWSICVSQKATTVCSHILCWKLECPFFLKGYLSVNTCDVCTIRLCLGVNAILWSQNPHMLGCMGYWLWQKTCARIQHECTICSSWFDTPMLYSLHLHRCHNRCRVVETPWDYSKGQEKGERFYVGVHRKQFLRENNSNGHTSVCVKPTALRTHGTWINSVLAWLL
jgi:hypothetical protein